MVQAEEKLIQKKVWDSKGKNEKAGHIKDT